MLADDSLVPTDEVVQRVGLGTTKLACFPRIVQSPAGEPFP